MIEEYLNAKHLPMDDFYDVAVFGFLRAVRLYDEDKELQTSEFRTLAYDNMHSSLASYFKNQKKKNKRVQILSLDYPLHSEYGETFGDTIADDKVNVCDEVCSKINQNSRFLHIRTCTKPLVYPDLVEMLCA